MFEASELRLKHNRLRTLNAKVAMMPSARKGETRGLRTFRTWYNQV